MKGSHSAERTRGRRGSSGAAGLLYPLLGACLLAAVVGYKPVVIVHGLFDSPEHFKTLKRYINESHPGTNVTVIDLFDREWSLKSMWTQVDGFKAAIYPILQNSAEGVNFICYSQGGLICRGILSTLSDHNVHTFIALSSPLAGQYGDTEYLKYFFPEKLKDNLYRFCYHDLTQEISVCDYWNDPHHQALFVNSSNYLAPLNGERPHSNSTEWKKNFLRIQKLVLIGGPDDGVISPWQSSQFGFYDDNETVVEMQDQEFYRNDSFGLKTLEARGDLIVCTVPGVQHLLWHSNETVFHQCIEKWLQ